MAKAKRLKWEDMTEEQRDKCERAAKKYGIPIKDVPMTVTGLIVLQKPDDVVMANKMHMVAAGWADSVEDITAEMYQEFIAECDRETKRLEADPIKLR